MIKLVHSILSLVLTLVLLFSVSCTTPRPIRGDVESLERGEAVSETPDTGDGEYIRAAERYSNPYSERYYHPSRGWGYRYW